MRRLVVANWKMNPVHANDVRRLCEHITGEAQALKRVDTVLCPPFPYLSLAAQYTGRRPNAGHGLAKTGGRVQLGAQDVFWEKEGPFTGEVSPLMLREMKCRWVVIGHSERRIHFAETDEMVAKKVRGALQYDLTPILCVGEHAPPALNDEERGEMEKTVSEQLTRGLANLTKRALPRLVIAYEPVWAISTTAGGAQACTPDDLLRVAIFIRKILRKMFSMRAAESVRILYGGSVSAANAKGYVSEEGIDGLLVGGASLYPEKFLSILRALEAA